MSAFCPAASKPWLPLQILQPSAAPSKHFIINQKKYICTLYVPALGKIAASEFKHDILIRKLTGLVAQSVM